MDYRKRLEEIPLGVREDFERVRRHIEKMKKMELLRDSLKYTCDPKSNFQIYEFFGDAFLENYLSMLVIHEGDLMPPPVRGEIKRYVQNQKKRNGEKVVWNEWYSDEFMRAKQKEKTVEDSVCNVVLCLVYYYLGLKDFCFGPQKPREVRLEIGGMESTDALRMKYPSMRKKQQDHDAGNLPPDEEKKYEEWMEMKKCADVVESIIGECDYLSSRVSNGTVCSVCGTLARDIAKLAVFVGHYLRDFAALYRP